MPILKIGLSLFPLWPSLQHDPDNILALEHQDFPICGEPPLRQPLPSLGAGALDLLVPIFLEGS